jgi:hypothetical protein
VRARGVAESVALLSSDDAAFTVPRGVRGAPLGAGCAVVLPTGLGVGVLGSEISGCASRVALMRASGGASASCALECVVTTDAPMHTAMTQAFKRGLFFSRCMTSPYVHDRYGAVF